MRKPVEFSRMVKRIADQHGVKAAQAWTEAVLAHQKGIDMARLRSAIASKNQANIEAVIASSKLQQTIQKAVQPPFLAASQAAGKGSQAVLKAHGIAASFNAVHPNVVNYARAQSAKLVVGIPQETKQVIAEVIALGAQYGLDIGQQARAIREVVSLPPAWAQAPLNLAREIRAGDAAAATGRRLSASAKQQIRSRIAAGTVTDAFVDDMTEQYSASLINRRALNIARTESLTAAHVGLTESWKQAQEQGALPESARRFWIVTPDARLSPEHARIPGMNPSGRTMDEPFVTPEGLFMHPPSRPNCRCSVGLLFNVPEGFDVTEGIDAEEALRSPAAESDFTPEEAPQVFADKLETLGRKNDLVFYHESPGDVAASIINRGLVDEANFATINQPSEFVTAPVKTRVRIRVPRQQLHTVVPDMRYDPEQAHFDLLKQHPTLRGADVAINQPIQPSWILDVDVIRDGKVVRTVPGQAPPLWKELNPRPTGGPVIAPRGAPRMPPATPDIPPPRVLAGAEMPSPELHAEVVKTLQKVNVKPEAVTYKRLQTFKLGDRIGQTAAEYKRGRIFIDPRFVDADGAAELVTHEAQHLKFDVAVKNDPRIRKFIDDNYGTLRAEDGVTAYSKEHWQAYEQSLVRFRVKNVPVATIPVNETLSEMAGARAIGAGESFYGSATYRKLEKMIDDAYAKAVRTGRDRVTRTGRIALRKAAEPQGRRGTLRDLAKGETPSVAEKELIDKHGSLTNYLDGLFEDNYRAAGAEADAIEAYGSFYYGQINNSLRSGNAEAWLKKVFPDDTVKVKQIMEWHKSLDKLMESMPALEEDVTVWRAVNNVTWLTPEIQSTLTALENASKLVGTEIVDSGFVSTTTLRQQAYKWAELKDGGTLIEIRVPKGVKGAWLGKVSPETQRNAIVKRELLLPRGAKFKVVDARVEGGIDRHSVLHLIVEYVP